MLEFNPRDPFPLLPMDQIEYKHETLHSLQVDQWLGLEIAQTEANLMTGGCRRRPRHSLSAPQEIWMGLAPTSLLTPYTEIRRTLHFLQLKPGQKLIDLGAAYGRIAFVILKCFPELRFCGYEYVGERVAVGQKALRKFFKTLQTRGAKSAADPIEKHIQMLHMDLTDRKFRPELADCYFIYDYGTPQAIAKTLFDLSRLADLGSFTLIARGQRTHAEIEKNHAWLQPMGVTGLSQKLRLFSSFKN